MKSWLPVFDTLIWSDQKFRDYDETMFYNHRKEQHNIDSANQVIVSSFLDKYGFPPVTQVGLKGIFGISSVLQHSPTTMQEKYYPVMVDAYKKGNIRGETLALLEDRINMHHHRKQYYGSQMARYQNHYTLYPVVNVDSLTVYRKRMGFLWTISQYLEMFNSKWDEDEYKKILPQLIELKKVTDTLGLHFVK